MVHSKPPFQRGVRIGGFFIDNWISPDFEVFIVMKEWTDIVCKVCGNVVKAEDRVKSPPVMMCREDYTLYCREKHQAIKREKMYWGNDIPLYANNNISNTPGVFYNDQQRDLVYDILKGMGWKHNTKKNIWFDDRIKDKDGNWLKDLGDRQVKYQKEVKSKWRKYIDGEISKIPHIRYNSAEVVFTPEQIRDIQIFYFVDGWGVKDLMKKYNTTYKDTNWVIITTIKKLRILTD